MENGYVVSIYGKKFLKEIIFLKKKPTEEELDSLIEEHKGRKAFIIKGEIYENEAIADAVI